MNDKSTSSLSRREFLKVTSATAATIALPTIIPSSVLGANGQTPPSERINLGIIGCGSMGTSNLTLCARYPAAADRRLSLSPSHVVPLTK